MSPPKGEARFRPLSPYILLTVACSGVFLAALLKEVAGLTPLGEAEVAGGPAYHLSGRVAASAMEPITGSSLPGAEVQVELWVGKEGFNLLQAKLTGQITPAEGTGMVRWLRFSQFNREISIVPPL